MAIKIARLLRLAARYVECPRALWVRWLGGIPETFWKLDELWFYELGLRTVIDVGANEGQFSLTMRGLLPEAQIWAFEPIPECFERTRQRFEQDPHYRVFNVALGDSKSQATFTVSADTGASSLLPMAELQATHFPHSLLRREIDVQVETLDGIMAGQPLTEPYLLKVDVQGYEFQVLSGGIRTLARASVVILEASHDPFYEGQKLFDEVYDLLRTYGFRLSDTFNLMRDPLTGRALQGDFLFLRIPIPS